MSWYKEHGNEWKEIISTVAAEKHKTTQMVEKDTIQSIVLFELSKSGIPFVFKGGTSLSKCYTLLLKTPVPRNRRTGVFETSSFLANQQPCRRKCTRFRQSWRIGRCRSVFFHRPGFLRLWILRRAPRRN